MKISNFGNIHTEVYALQEWSQRHREEAREHRVRASIRREQPSSSNYSWKNSGVIPKGKKQKGFKGDVTENKGFKSYTRPVVSQRRLLKELKEELFL